MNIARESAPLVARLKQGIIDAHHLVSAHATSSLGHPDIDAILGGGLAGGRLHELLPAEPADMANTAGFALMLARQAALTRPEKPIFWVREASAERRLGRPHAPGLAELGLDPAAFVFVTAPDGTALLRASEEIARCAGVGALMIELGPSALRRADLTASRRLALAAGKAGTVPLMLRPDGKEAPSAAWTRWRVASAPSALLAANAPGHARLDIELLRHRAGPSGQKWRVEWDREQACFSEAALPGAVLPLPARRSPSPVVAAMDGDWRLSA